MSDLQYRRRLRVILAIALIAGCVGIGWGLPNGNQTWAADSVAPMAPLSVAYHVFAEHGFNSGYFYFKYPVGHHLVLAAVEAPVLLVALMRGDLHGVNDAYPYGFDSPETYLTAMALATRALSVVLACGVLALLAGIGRRLGGRHVGLFAALLGAGSYPIVFYAHTSNVEIPFLFWALLSLYACIRATEGYSPRWYWLVGAAAAMAVSTKEQIAGFLVLLPVVLLLEHWRRAATGEGARTVLPAGAISGALIAAVVFAIANAAFFNPLGVLRRIQFLAHALDPAVRAKYAPYEFPIDLSTSWTLADELDHVRKAAEGIVTSIGWHAAALAAVGIFAMALRHRRALLWVLAPLVGYHVVSLRILKQVEIRYTLPLSTILLIPAAFAIAALWRSGRVGRGLAALSVAGGLVYSGEVLSMLVADARYAAERWMASRLEAGKRVEVYQSWTYLPRWKREVAVTKPAFDEISIAALARRAPDFVVISSKGKEGIMMYPNPDWRDGRGMMLVREDNRQFLDALEAGRLGYRPVASFARPRWIERTLITSLDPSITVYARESQVSDGVAEPRARERP